MPCLLRFRVFLWLLLVTLHLTPSRILLSQALEPHTVSALQSVPCTRSPKAVTLDLVASASGLESGVRPSSAPLSPLEAALEDIPMLLERLRVEVRAPGAAVIVVQGGRTLYYNSSGSANADGSFRAFTEDTIVQIASNTKMFTTLAAYKLRDEGRLSLDDPVSKWLPHFKLKNGLGGRREVVLRALALHASGLVRETPSCPACKTNESAVLEALAAEPLPLLFPQFTSTAYSNLGLALLGRALEKATAPRVGYEEYVEARILRPMGMLSSGFNYSEAVRGRMAVGVDPASGRPVPLPSAPFEWDAPCGYMYSSCADMARFMVLAMNHSAPASPSDEAGGGGGGPHVVDGATWAEMQLTGTVAGAPSGFSGVGAGTYEWALMGNGTEWARWAVTKAGCLDGYRSDTFMVPELQLGIFAVATSTCDVRGDGDAISFPIANLLMPAVHQELLQAQAASQGRGGWLPPQPGRFAGRYTCCCAWECGDAFSVGVENSTLVVRRWDGTLPLQLQYLGSAAGAALHAPQVGAAAREAMLRRALDLDAESPSESSSMRSVKSRQVARSMLAAPDSRSRETTAAHPSTGASESESKDPGHSSDVGGEPIQGTAFSFRMHMIGPYLDDEECWEDLGRGQQRTNVCPTSCEMRMTRGDRSFLRFIVEDGQSATAIWLVSEGLGKTCVKVA